MFETFEVEKASFKVKTKGKEEKKLKRAYFLFLQKVFLKYLKLGTNFDCR